MFVQIKTFLTKGRFLYFQKFLTNFIHFADFNFSNWTVFAGLKFPQILTAFWLLFRKVLVEVENMQSSFFFKKTEFVVEPTDFYSNYVIIDFFKLKNWVLVPKSHK